MLNLVKKRIRTKVEGMLDNIINTRMPKENELYALREQLTIQNNLLAQMLAQNSFKNMPIPLSSTTDRIYTHTKDGHRIFLDMHDFHMTCHVLESGIWEEHVRYVFRKFLKPGARVIDVGANVGLHSLYLGSLVGPNGKVYCFEPAPRTASILKTNIDLNGYNGWVHISEKAVCATNETREFVYLPGQAGMSSFKATYGEVREKITVETTTLNDFFKDNMKIDLLKIDVESFEYEVLLGAKNLFDYNENLVVLMEYHPAFIRKTSGENKVNELLAFFKERGYKLYTTSWPVEKMIRHEFDDPILRDNGFDLVFTKDTIIE